jgi:predicted DNA-binding antitoxin AbrB/MazE fold protein
MEALQIEAIYENGVLRPLQELPLQEGQKVAITIQPTGNAVKRFVGLVPWPGDREEFDSWLNDPDEGQWGLRDVP